MLTKDDLQKIIEQFDEKTLKQQGIFGIAHYRGMPDENYIRANREGLVMFALQLLKAARDSTPQLSDNENNITALGYHEDWIDEHSDIFIQHIQHIADQQMLKPTDAYQPKIMDKLVPFGCGLVGIILLVSLVTGFVTLWKWLF